MKKLHTFILEGKS